MARVTNPFLSMDASGTIGLSLTACKWKGRNYMRKHFVPANPNSLPQQSIRTAVKMSSQEFSGLVEGSKDAWNEYAAKLNNSGIAIWMKKAVDAWMDQHGTTEQPDTLSVTDDDDPDLAEFTWTAKV